VSFEDIENILSKLVFDLEPAPEAPTDAAPFEIMTLDRSEKDNSKWIELISGYLKTAKTFEIHCWNEETEWIDLALQYGQLKEDTWKYGKIIVGEVTSRFVEMLLNLPKPTDTEIDNKMTPFFNVFLDKNFQSCHYGTEMALAMIDNGVEREVIKKVASIDDEELDKILENRDKSEPSA